MPGRLPLLTRHPARTCAVLILVHALLLLRAARSNSVTFDEFAHLPAGVAYWRHADFSIFDLSPPLLRLVAAAPPVLAGAAAPPTADVDARPAKDRHWVYGQLFQRANLPRYQFLFVLGRCALIPLSCLGAYLVYHWSRSLHGVAAGLAACALYCFSPNVLAHASLVTTDAGTMVAMAAAVYAWWRCCRAPTAGRIAVAAALVAAAQLCKFTALLLFPAMVALAAWELVPAGSRRRAPRMAAAFVVAVLTSLVAINACYLFHGTGAPLADYDFRSPLMASVQRHLPGRLPVPLPRAYVEGFDAQKFEAEGTHQGFLLGDVYQGSRWYFYPVTLAIKTPAGTLALAALTLVSLLRRRPTRDESACLIAAGVFVTGMVGLADINIGVRYLLPAYPLAYVLISRLWSASGPSPSDDAVGAPHGHAGLLSARSVLLAIALLEPLLLLRSPDFLPFANVLVGGPARAWRLVNDSNYDWGQDLLRLKAWVDANHVDSIHLGYFGRADPATYGIPYTRLDRPSADPYVVVSTYYLAGLAHRLPSPDGPGPFTHIPFHAELAARAPVAVVGRTLYVYDRATVAAAMAEHRRAAGPPGP